MSVIEAIFLGVVQGLTEFIPVSSSGHLLLLHEIFGRSEDSLGFDVALHVGTLLALVIYFRRDIYELILNVLKPTAEGRLARLVTAATLPAVCVGLLFSDVIDDTLRSPAVVAVSLAVVGLLMIAVDRRPPGNSGKEITTKQGLSVGASQILALIPGVSRSGITITTGVLSGLSREQATRFSFLLAMPIVAGSALGVIVKGDVPTESAAALVAGMIAAFGSGLLAIKFMLKSIAKLGLKPFAYYRLVLALIVLIFLV
jgi:undecaprenyl-diphosphatase